jgi:hypothetical protein
MEAIGPLQDHAIPLELRGVHQTGLEDRIAELVHVGLGESGDRIGAIRDEVAFRAEVGRARRGQMAGQCKWEGRIAATAAIIRFSAIRRSGTNVRTALAWTTSKAASGSGSVPMS